MRVRMRLAIFVPLVLGIPFASATRAAAAPTSKLTYVRGDGAEACPDESELRRAVAKRVGYDPFFPWAERTVVAQIDTTTGGSGFIGQVRIIDSRGKLLGERKLARISDCAELVQSMALAISVAIDDLDTTSATAGTPTRTEDEPPPIARQAPGPVSDEAPDPPERPPPSARPTPRMRWHLRTWLGAGGTLGVAPSPSVGAVVGVAASASWFWLGIEGRADLPSRASIEPTAGGRIATSLLMGSIVPCGFVRNVSPSPYLCAVGSLGSLGAKSEDVSGPKSSNGRWLAVGGRAGLAITIAGDWLEVYGQFDAGATLTRHRLDLNGTEVYRVPAGSVSMGAGLAATLF